MTGPTRTSADLDDRRRRLLYRAWHRGTREMDLIMGSFCEAEIDGLSDADLAAFETLIEVADPTLYGWISEPETIPREMRSPLLERLTRSRAHQAARQP
jgi:antitoxin CptB